MLAHFRHVPRFRQALTGAFAAVACLLLSDLCFHAMLASLPTDFVADPLLFVTRIVFDPYQRSSISYVLVNSFTAAFSPYMLGQTLVVGSLIGLLLPRVIRQSRPLAATLGIAAALGFVGVVAVAAATATSYAFQFHFQRPETIRAVRMVLVHHLSFSAPWAVLLSCLIAARLHHRAA